MVVFILFSNTRISHVYSNLHVKSNANADLVPGERMQLVLVSGSMEQVKLAYAEVRRTR